MTLFIVLFVWFRYEREHRTVALNASQWNRINYTYYNKNCKLIVILYGGHIVKQSVRETQLYFLVMRRENNHQSRRELKENFVFSHKSSRYLQSPLQTSPISDEGPIQKKASYCPLLAAFEPWKPLRPMYICGVHFESNFVQFQFTTPKRNAFHFIVTWVHKNARPIGIHLIVFFTYMFCNFYVFITSRFYWYWYRHKDFYISQVKCKLKMRIAWKFSLAHFVSVDRLVFTQKKLY